MARRDVVLNKLDHYCTRFNRGWKRGESWFKGRMPHLAVAIALLFLWDAIVTPGLHYWVEQHRGVVNFLNRHEWCAYVYGYGMFLVLPLFFAIVLTHGVFRLVRAVRLRISSKT
jgi:hypothetical protein